MICGPWDYEYDGIVEVCNSYFVLLIFKFLSLNLTIIF
uniref:Uncharacterized protein n=1 Tax=Vitis vinifera TaxID=29760 RepID=F6GV50_VITVI